MSLERGALSFFCDPVSEGVEVGEALPEPSERSFDDPCSEGVSDDELAASVGTCTGSSVAIAANEATRRTLVASETKHTTDNTMRLDIGDPRLCYVDGMQGTLQPHDCSARVARCKGERRRTECYVDSLPAT